MSSTHVSRLVLGGRIVPYPSLWVFRGIDFGRREASESWLPVPNWALELWLCDCVTCGAPDALPVGLSELRLVESTDLTLRSPSSAMLYECQSSENCCPSAYQIDGGRWRCFVFLLAGVRFVDSNGRMTENGRSRPHCLRSRSEAQSRAADGGIR